MVLHSVRYILKKITGIGISALHKIRSNERISDLFQITNAELVAILKTIPTFESTEEKLLVILTDSLCGCKWLEKGLQSNYLVHLIREKITRMSDRIFTIQWIPSYVGIAGNDEADDFANRACHLENISPL